MEFSVLLSVYHRENPRWLRQSLESIAAQTVSPSEVIIVKDGPLPQSLERILEEFCSTGQAFHCTCVSLDTNRGLGVALEEGLRYCHTEWVARMDADDIALPERFEKQIDYLSRHPDTDIVGGWIAEFDRDPQHPGSVRRVPLGAREILRFAKRRNPFNHMTVMFRKSAVEAAGGYRHFPGFEDYALWVRMLLNGAVAANLPEILVAARTGAGMIRRRRGWEYVRREWRFQRWMREVGFLSTGEMLGNMLLRIPPRLLPGPLVQKVYSILRK